MGVLTQYENDISSGIDNDLMNNINKIGSDPLDTTAQTLSGAVNELNYDIDDINTTLGGIINFIYPVGCYFETTDTTFNPNTTWTGTTWELETEGLVHISSGSNYTVSNLAQDGGEASHLLTAAESGSPEHGHNMTQAAYTVPSSGGITNGITGGSHAHSSKGWAKVTDGSGNYITLGGAGQTTTYSTNTSTHSHSLPNHTHTVNISTNASVNSSTATNASTAHNNMQPYKIVNRWHRTA